MATMIANQSKQMFQQQKFHQEQLKQMQTSINNAVASINYGAMIKVPE
ncbi:hypothetical protein [uncultured Limosilactobacillus sp.]|nr:hypothetical protein [uncultured Limosilactobacillus sp.]